MDHSSNSIPKPMFQQRSFKNAMAKLDSLAKPPGALGVVEAVAAVLAGVQGTLKLNGTSAVAVFAADHGAMADHVSAYPAEVTMSMLSTIINGRATVSCFSKNAGAHLFLVNVGANHPLSSEMLQLAESNEALTLVNQPVAHGTKNIREEPAMTLAECEKALQAGREIADTCSTRGVGVLAIGELGIGNTASAAAIAGKLLGKAASEVVGPGTGLVGKGLARKVAVVQKALDRTAVLSNDAKVVLAELGGFEIAAMAGCMLRCRERGIAVVVDGFISSVAALVACRMEPEVVQFCIFSTLSAEPGHVAVVDGIKGDKCGPLLDLKLRLGEASAAALALPIVQAAASMFAGIATLEEVMKSSI